LHQDVLLGTVLIWWEGKKGKKDVSFLCLSNHRNLKAWNFPPVGSRRGMAEGEVRDIRRMRKKTHTGLKMKGAR
jgi:hypothetical protein